MWYGTARGRRRGGRTRGGQHARQAAGWGIVKATGRAWPAVARMAGLEVNKGGMVVNICCGVVLWGLECVPAREVACGSGGSPGDCVRVGRWLLVVGAAFRTCGDLACHAPDSSAVHGPQSAHEGPLCDARDASYKCVGIPVWVPKKKMDACDCVLTHTDTAKVGSQLGGAVNCNALQYRVCSLAWFHSYCRARGTRRLGAAREGAMQCTWRQARCPCRHPTCPRKETYLTWALSSAFGVVGIVIVLSIGVRATSYLLFVSLGASS